jgi:hypothetical protein
VHGEKKKREREKKERKKERKKKKRKRIQDVGFFFVKTFLK